MTARRKRRVRTPTVLQMEAVECGAASLAMVLAYYGRVVPLTELRQTCGISRDGSKASSIVKAARVYGLTARGFRKEPAELRELTMPIIVFWEFNHFVVVDGFSKGCVHLNDPAVGPRTVTDEEFDRSFTGVVMTFEPGDEFVRSGRFPSLTGALRQRLAGSHSALIYGVLAGMALIIPGLLIPAYGRIFVDDILVSGLEAWIRPLIAAMGLTLFLLLALNWLQQYILFRLGQKLELSTSGRFIWHVLHLPIAFFDLRYAADVASRTQLNERVAQLLSARVAANLVNVTMIAFYAFVMIQYDVLLTVIGVAIALLNLVALRVSSAASHGRQPPLRAGAGQGAGHLVQRHPDDRDLKAGGTESDFFARWAGFQAKSIRAEQDLAVTTGYVSVVPTLLSGLTTVAILIVGGERVISGTLSIGALVAFQYLIAAFSAPVNGLVNLGGEIQEIDAGMVRLDDVLSYPTDPTLAAHPPGDGPWPIR